MFISQLDAYCMRWVEFRALALCQVTPHLTTKTTHTTRSPTEGFVQNSAWILALTFASRSAKTTALAMYSETIPMATMCKRSGCVPRVSNLSSQRFADEGGTDEKGNKLEYIRNDQGADRQFEYFVPDTAQGLTQSGPSQLNQSIEAFVYCVLGAQVNVCSSILGNVGRAKEAQRDFLILLEGAIRTPDISKSVQCYQLAIDEAKVCLDFVAAPGTWLMASRIVINTGSVMGYNNQLKQAVAGMKLGINNDVNNSTKKEAFT